jgi:hypothetical protein
VQESLQAFRQRLEFKDKLLYDSDTLAACGVTKDSEVELIGWGFDLVCVKTSGGKIWSLGTCLTRDTLDKLTEQLQVCTASYSCKHAIHLPDILKLKRFTKYKPLYMENFED